MKTTTVIKKEKLGVLENSLFQEIAVLIENLKKML